MGSRRLASGAARRTAMVLVVGALMAACSASSGDDPAGDADEAATTAAPTPSVTATVDGTVGAFLEAWEADDAARLDALVMDASAAPAGTHRTFAENLGATALDLEVVVEPVTPVDAAPGTAVMVPVDVTMTLDGLGEWTYRTELVVVATEAGWAVDWSPTTVHPALTGERRIERTSSWPERGRILAVDGTPLRLLRPVVEIGIEPQKIVDRDMLIDELVRLLDIDGDEVGAALDAPGVQPDWFVPVATKRADEAVLAVAAARALPGVVVREGTGRRAPTDDFARQVLGVTGPITGELLDQFGHPYAEGDIVGLGGLELMHELALAGSPSGDIRVLDANGERVAVLQRFPGRAPIDVVTTLNADVQAAAEAALADVTLPAAIVAIDAASGEIRAVVSQPVDDFGRALGGAYPPGSTFKIVTAAAALTAGAAPADPAPCPTEAFVGGLRFTNFGGETFGAVDLRTAFARSCNTSFVSIAEALGVEALDTAATTFGFGVEPGIGLGAVGGTVPAPIDTAELAAQAIGQGRVTASPLHMASVAAAVVDGRWRPPRLVLDPAPAAPTGDEDEAVRLPVAVAEALRSMMRSVVTSGTAGALAGVSGEVIAKTGSAEFGDDDPPMTHAWVIGARGDLAFAVLVEGGGAGGAVAAPIAATFLRGIG